MWFVLARLHLHIAMYKLSTAREMSFFLMNPSTLPHIIFFSELACTETAQKADSINPGLTAKG